MSRLDRDDPYWLPGVTLDVDGELVPAREQTWAMYASCGCIAGLHLVTQETVTEEMAWKRMTASVQMIKRDKERGFYLRLVKHREIPFDDCKHSPKWGYIPPPTPIGFVWATTRSTRALHLVPLTALDAEQMKQLGREWEEGGYDRVSTLCGRNKGCPWEWSKKFYNTDGKLECAHCVKTIEKRCLPLFEGSVA